MLGAKTAAVVAVATLAIAETQAEIAAHLRVRVHAKVTCPSGQQTIGVAGWAQDGCVASGSVCVDQVSNGACPTGAHCALLDTGVYGCKDGGEEAGSWAGCSGSEQTIGVVGWDHDGCIDSANVCVAQVSNGDCPAGAYCSLLDTGVYGCVASSQKRNRHHKTLAKSSATCPSGQEAIGVEGWSEDGCVTSGNVCSADVSSGDCPTGAQCTLLASGVYGCADGASSDESSNAIPSNSTSSNSVGSDSVGSESTGSESTSSESTSVKKHHHHHHHKSHHKSSVTCPSGQESIGVEGWSQDGCVASGNVCVANTDGTCPSGAHCEWLDTGVFGCKDGAEEAGSWAGCSGSEQTIGVVGWDHDGCIDSANVCVAQVSNGDCPAGAYCSLLDTGVYGCVASSQKRNRHHKTLAKSSATCPSGQEAIGVEGWSEDGCVTSGNVCSADVSSGDCPTGAQCTLLASGVYGCADGASSDESSNAIPSNSTSSNSVGSDSVGSESTGSESTSSESTSVKKHHHHHHHKSHHKSSVTCPSGQESIGVEGWSQDGCVASGNVCVANTDGTCPSGAHCEWLDTGVFGCKDGAEEAGSWAGCSGSEQTIGVVGWDHDGCIDSANVCVAQVSNGDCPAGAYCSLLDTGVYGCVASSKH
ncbi:hypothetical protein PRNP1_013049 [Phytophthora ramorum]